MHAMNNLEQKKTQYDPVNKEPLLFPKQLDHRSPIDIDLQLTTEAARSRAIMSTTYCRTDAHEQKWLDATITV